MRDAQICKTPAYQSEVPDILGARRRRWTRGAEALHGKVCPAVDTDGSIRVGHDVIDNFPEELVRERLYAGDSCRHDGFTPPKSSVREYCREERMMNADGLRWPV